MFYRQPGCNETVISKNKNGFIDIFQLDYRLSVTSTLKSLFNAALMADL